MTEIREKTAKDLAIEHLYDIKNISRKFADNPRKAEDNYYVVVNSLEDTLKPWLELYTNIKKEYLAFNKKLEKEIKANGEGVVKAYQINRTKLSILIKVMYALGWLGEAEVEAD